MQDQKKKGKRIKVKKEYITRLHNEFMDIPVAEKKSLPCYPWNKGKVGHLPKITKEYFRCRGSSLNPAKIGEPESYFDCTGSKHSLPLRHEKEFVYPILIDLLNWIQVKTGKRVIITSGHRCPQHNKYVNACAENLYSKHQLGAEVSFYVEGFENKPEGIIRHLLAYYEELEKYKGQKEFEFRRYEKGDTNVSTQPWYNKEIFIKLFKKEEGRDFDNRHSYPYIAIQLRYDSDLKEKVAYSWEKANNNYFRN